MARTTLSHPFDSISGKLASNDKIVMRTRNGRTHAYVVKRMRESGSCHGNVDYEF